jgi:hypothetical protein
LKRRSARSKSPDEDETHFLNVDLDVFARSRLEPLATAFGSKVTELYIGAHGSRYAAHFELHASPRRGANALIVALVRLVKSLRGAARLAWNQASRRDFNIGIQGGLKPHSYELSLNPATLKLVSSVNARVVVTIYGAEGAAALPMDDPSRKQKRPGRLPPSRPRKTSKSRPRG